MERHWPRCREVSDCNATMACANMFGADRPALYGGGAGGAAPPPPMSPRISFSNDFVPDAAGCPTVRYERASPAAASASHCADFEFSVESYGMMTADELFFKGRLLPLDEHCAADQTHRKTLRDELLAADDDDGGGGFAFPPPSRLPGKPSHGWKSLLGLRKLPHPSTRKKNDKKQEKLPNQGAEGEEELISAGHPGRADEEGRDAETMNLVTHSFSS